ncbi:hypothetical protein CHCC20372_1057 [Bacillus paralicheniformis]|nr:hypothetical protein CHCC20372_1057 [Bacillus paralicheniformis]
MKNENTKIQEAVICDDMFVEYPYYKNQRRGNKGRDFSLLESSFKAPYEKNA